MGKLVINQNQVTKEIAEKLQSICPFGAISYDDEKLDISSACKTCKLCVRNSDGVIEYIEETVEIDKSLWNGICVYADCSNGSIHKVTYELCGKARELSEVTGHEVFSLLIGHDIRSAAEDLLHYGVDKVYVYDDPGFCEFRIEPYTSAFYDFIEKIHPSSILVGATNLGRQLAPRVAARCRTGLTADCTVLQIKDNTDLVQIRPAFGGNIMAQIVTPNTRPQFCTARYKVFNEPPRSPEASGEIISMEVTPQMLCSKIEVISSNAKPKILDIADADVIVAVGRGAASLLQQAAELADLLGGVVACTRPLVENNTFDAKHQIGLSGRTVKPKLIICLGISGAVQFAAGMKSSDCIVAINTDPAAPIFDIAHYCITGDVNQILPMLIKKIKEGM